MHPSPSLPGILMTLLAVVCTALLIAGFRYGVRHAELPTSPARRASAFLTLGAILWFVLTGVLAHRGFFSDFTARPPRLLFALLLPAVVLAVISFTSRALPAALRGTPVTWLFYLQHSASSWSSCSGVGTNSAPSLSR